jgi:methyl-accepting chemotaxis protein
MSNTTLFVTQIASTIVFVIALFVLYRLLVEQKEATIQLLKEKIDWLQNQLNIAKESSPDTLLKQLDQRIKVYADELGRLSKDKNISDTLLKEKEQELEEMRSDIRKVSERLQRSTQALKAGAEAMKKG